MDELVEVLTEDGNLIGERINKISAHKNGICHGISAVALIDNNGRLLIQKRADTKKDEIDSGFDVDELKVVANSITKQKEETGLGLIVVSHYERFYTLLQPTHAHVLVDGRILVSGDASLAAKIDTEGYEWISKEYDIDLNSKEDTYKRISLGSCAAAKRG